MKKLNESPIIIEVRLFTAGLLFEIFSRVGEFAFDGGGGGGDG
jgi:hypothetical protein